MPAAVVFPQRLGHLCYVLFEKRDLSRTELNQLPQFNCQEESLSSLTGRALWPARLLLSAAPLIEIFRLQRYQRFPVTN
jgi:hypothetical protein